MSNSFKVDIATHVIPMLRLVQSATMLYDMLNSVDQYRQFDPELDARLKTVQCTTCLGASIAEETTWVLSTAIDLLQAHTESE